MSASALSVSSRSPVQFPGAAFQQSEITQFLQRLNSGEEQALDGLMPVIYDYLKVMARRALRGEQTNSALETSALVHEAYLKLLNKRIQWRDPTHFFAAMAQIMRRLLVDRARHRNYQKYGGGWRKVDFEHIEVLGYERRGELTNLEDALERLMVAEPEGGKVVVLRFFGGLSHEEIAEVLGVSLRTVERRWQLARAWLFEALAVGGAQVS